MEKQHGYSILMRIYTNGNMSQYLLHSINKDKLNWKGWDLKRVFKTSNGARRCLSRVNTILASRTPENGVRIETEMVLV